MNRWLFMVTLVAIILLVEVGASGQAFLMETGSLDDNWKIVRTGTAQRCYSFSCYDIRTSVMK